MATGKQDSQVATDGNKIENGQPADPSNNVEEEVWDEERNEKGLKTLKEMHIQVSLTWIVSLQEFPLIDIASWLAIYYTTTPCAPDC